jgi:hypothetical protein
MNKQSVRKFHLLGFVGFFAVIALFGVVVMFLWNYLLPPIFDLPQIGYLQAAGLLILSRILFGGLGFHGGRLTGAGIAGGKGYSHGNPFREKWMNMSEEQRKEFMEKHRGYHHLHKFFDNDEPDVKNSTDAGK